MKLGLDINSKDKRLSTPLHWAAFIGAELALPYILANGADVDAQDIEGLSPMHLAVIYSENVLSTRFIRALLLKGADPTIKSHSGKLPIDQLDEFNE